MAQISMTLSDL